MGSQPTPAIRQVVNPPAQLRVSRGTAEGQGCFNAPAPCLTEDQILGFVGADLRGSQLALVDDHLNACQACANLLVEALRAGKEGSSDVYPATSRCCTFSPGDRIAQRYVVRHLLGRGGMGDVYEALDLENNQRVAVKTARATLCDLVNETRRLTSEFDIARRVVHRNVRRVHELGVHQDEHLNGSRIAFLTMDLIQGPSLAELRRLMELNSAQVIVLAKELLRGVRAIHRAGAIHRDIKSHNIMLRGGDVSRIAIIDFGLAVEDRAAIVGELPSGSSPCSLEGSPAYMAPEQFDGGVVTPATDVFACGVVVFEALTGTLPFRSLRPEKNRTWRNPREVALRATTLTTGVPSTLDCFIARCLELDPSKRFASANDAIADLEGSTC